MKQKILILFALATLLITIKHSRAGLGWSFDECVQHYGQTTQPNTRTASGRVLCVFSVKGYDIDAFFMSNTVSRIAYISPIGFDKAGVEEFLATNGPGAAWEGPYKDNSDGSYRWHSTKDGAPAYAASLNHERHSLLIWTKEDDDFGRTQGSHEEGKL
jgi:hypothetical protein